MKSLPQLLSPCQVSPASSAVRSRRNGLVALACLLAILPAQRLPAQPYGPPDQGQPGDAMIQEYLRQTAERLEDDFLGAVRSAGDWIDLRPRFRREYMDMLGLWPVPEKTPLRAAIARTLDRGDYQVDMLHYQSRPGLYVTANLYRPAAAPPEGKWPGILYVCGHSARGRNGNKTAYQSHGIWLARHGYVCLTVDTLQLGELAGLHHGTYREGRWEWLSRGYTPAGVECWNGIRGLDYLASRPDVDPNRLGVTGISGGGAATFWIAAADDRVRVAVPVSGMADLASYVGNRVINGHCDCMFLYNAHRWPWTRIAALIAPRALLFVNSDQDRIFPMDANERVINRLERLYSLFGAGDCVDSVVSIGDHAYRADIRQAAFRFLNTHLKNDPRPVTDTEVDLVARSGEISHPIPPEELRVFVRDTDLPADALNGQIDRTFVPMAKVALPAKEEFAPWRDRLLGRIRERVFGDFPARVSEAQPVSGSTGGVFWASTEPGIRIRLRAARAPSEPPERVWLWVAGSDVESPLPAGFESLTRPGDAVYLCEPRGVGGTSWTRKNPPNYVERAHYLLGRTVDSGRVWDIASAVRLVRARSPSQCPVHLAGEGAAALLCVYAALLEPDVDALVLIDPAATHEDPAAPALLNILRVCDAPEAAGLLAPRPVTIAGSAVGLWQKTSAIYEAAGAAGKFVVKP
ncbi:MAG TPA: prolyl oligopeptidase family serine peptidase [Candidatus Paceibacterota bacterium]|nr:prolyl oligopeptidase family serine peptidase [Verrucomicrobiota bacterium]HRZ45589.1 prolyl oligopeptidase family serine peptidase [Candidatus Paceibacterota bacterium]HRZ91408.1 prolyl oligopeptidase family serine peptidase [Candidatus Paceibacterota bacterium]